jgi:transcription termination factor Rho
MAEAGGNLDTKSLSELHELAAASGVPRYRALRREELIGAILAAEGGLAATEAGGDLSEQAGPRVEIEELEELEGPPSHAGMTGGPDDIAPGQSALEPLQFGDLPEEAEPRGRVEIEEIEELEGPPSHPGVTGGPDDYSPGHPHLEELPAGERREPPGAEEREAGSGVLDLVPDGFGFLRVEGFGRSRGDLYVSRAQIRRLGLRQGDELAGPLRPMRRSDRHPSLAEVETVNSRPPEDVGERPAFDSLTAVHPDAPVPLAPERHELGARMLELAAPLLKGQRYVIASPPRAGATTLLKEIVGVEKRAGVEPIVVLVDVRPEEATDWERTVDAPVHASNSDRSADAHVQFAALALERAKRLVEGGEDVFLVVDSLTRLARAHSLARARSRRSGDGVANDDGAAIQAARRWFATARNAEGGGSLTILATVRTGSGSAFEQSLYESVSDLASAELRLDAELARAGKFPAVDLPRSYWRAEGPAAEGERAEHLRRLHRSLEPLGTAGAWENLEERIRETGSNDDLLASLY